MKVLVAVLGNYRTYELVNYELDGKVIECVKSSAEAVKRVKKPDRTFVFLPSTLYHGIVGEPGEGKYSALAEAMLNAVRSDSSFPDPMKQDNMYVVPNTGRFKGSKAPGVYEYRERGGDISFLQNYAFFKLYEALKDVREDLEVYVDMTHGVNYTSFLVSDAVRALVQALVVSANSPPDLKGVKATVTFYNSDVYARETVDYAKCKQGSQAAQGDASPPPLKVNPVLVETVDSRTAFTALLDQLLTTDRRELEALFGTDTDKVVKLARAARSGLFLAVSTCKDFLERALERIEERLRELENCGVKVEKGEITNVTYDCSVPRSTYRVFAALWAVYSAISGGEKEGVERSWFLDRVNKYADAVTKAIVENELERFNPDKLREISIKEGEWYYVSVKQKDPVPCESNRESVESLDEVTQRHQRNFAAHGGLLNGLACFKLHDGKVYFKYGIEGANACDEILQYIV